MFFFVSLYLNEENNFVNECVDVVCCVFFVIIVNLTIIWRGY